MAAITGESKPTPRISSLFSINQTLISLKMKSILILLAAVIDNPSSFAAEFAQQQLGLTAPCCAAGVCDACSPCILDSWCSYGMCQCCCAGDKPYVVTGYDNGREKGEGCCREFCWFLECAKKRFREPRPNEPSRIIARGRPDGYYDTFQKKNSNQGGQPARMSMGD